MPDNIDPIEQVIDELNLDRNAPSKVQRVGSGISETTRVSIDALANPALLDKSSAPWTENNDMIVHLFTPVFQRSLQCPGRKKKQCCQAMGDQICFPHWQEREDPEWYALEINKYLTIVSSRFLEATPIAAELAADAAFELGCLVSEAVIKFRWDGHAKRGKKTLDSAGLGGNAKRHANPMRLTVGDTVAAVDALLTQSQQKNAAYLQVASDQGVTGQTIGKEYRKAKKMR